MERQRIVFDNGNNFRKIRSGFDAEAEQAVELIGLGGNDTLDGSNKDDIIDGGDGNDRLTDGPAKGFGIAGEGDDLLLGGPGDDLLIGSAGTNTLEGGLGNDRLINGFGINNVLRGGEGNDVVRGTGFLFGDNGNDVLGGNGTLEGGNGSDRIQGGPADGNVLRDFGPAGETNRISGRDGNDIVQSGDGNEIVNTRGGNDRIETGAGNDQISTGSGRDTVIAGLGNDTITFLGGLGGNDPDVLIGVDPNNGAGRGEIDEFKQDSVVAGPENRRKDKELFVLGDENNVFYQGEGNNDFARIRSFQVGLDRFQLKGSANQYTVAPAPGGIGIFFGFDPANRDLVALIDDDFGNPPRREISLTDPNMFVFVGPGGGNPDNGGAKGERIIGSGRADTLNGTAGDDTISGRGGNDQINGLDGNDVIDGGVGNDVAVGGNGNDRIRGANGRDTLDGTGDNFGVGEVDRLTGNRGFDTFLLHKNGVVLYDDGNNQTNGTADFAVIEDFRRGQERIEVAGERSQYFIADAPLDGIDGDGIFFDTNGNGRFNANTDELIAVVDEVNNLSLDDLTFKPIPQVQGSNRRDRLQGTNADGLLDAKGGNDNVKARGGDDVGLGGRGHDTIRGGNGDDILDGGNGNDILRGQAGDDILNGGRGSDTLIGGIGADVFILAPGEGTDSILDYRDGVDQLAIAGNIPFEVLDIVQINSDVSIQFEGEQLGILSNVQADQITADDFAQLSYVHSQIMDVVLPMVDSSL